MFFSSRKISTTKNSSQKIIYILEQKSLIKWSLHLNRSWTDLVIMEWPLDVLDCKFIHLCFQNEPAEIKSTLTLVLKPVPGGTETENL